MKKITIINSKVQEIRLQRDLFGRMLAISMDERIYRHRKFLLFHYHPFQCHCAIKTDQSVLLKLLEKDIRSVAPTHTDVCLIDRFYLIHCMKDIEKTFGNIYL